MKIKQITWMYRRDFKADYECEHCGHIQSGDGYDDSNFHNNVIPAMICKECGKSAEGKVTSQAKDPDWVQK